jgi:polyhydroxybutyrate depolymerase
MSLSTARMTAASFSLGLLLAACGGGSGVGNDNSSSSTGSGGSSGSSSGPFGTGGGSSSGTDSSAWSGSAAPADVNLVSGTQAFVHTVDGRQVLYVIPDPAPTGPAPLMIVLDYLGGNPAFMANLIYAAQHAAKGEQFAFPEQSGLTWNDGLAENGNPQVDIDFLADVIADAVKMPVDPTRISMTGYSEGGFMANEFACNRPDLISGYGMVGASQLKTTTCESTTPLKMMDISGTDDKEAPYNGFGNVEPAQTDLTIWDGIDGCSGAIVSTDLPTVVNDGTSVVKFQVDGCNAILYEIVGGGHDWPGAEVTTTTTLLGKTSGNLDATEVQWEFFSGT